MGFVLLPASGTVAPTPSCCASTRTTATGHLTIGAHITGGTGAAHHRVARHEVRQPQWTIPSLSVRSFAVLGGSGHRRHPERPVRTVPPPHAGSTGRCDGPHPQLYRRPQPHRTTPTSTPNSHAHAHAPRRRPHPQLYRRPQTAQTTPTSTPTRTPHAPRPTATGPHPQLHRRPLQHPRQRRSAVGAGPRPN